jgi:RNA recognition motif-containing protein
MSKRLYVGNLPFSTTNEDLAKMFSTFGNVTEAQVVINKFSGRSKGFGFVTVEDDEQATKAVAEMNGKEINGRKVVVNEAKPFDPNAPRPPRRDFGGDRRGGYGGGRSGFGGGRGRSFGGNRGGGFSRRSEGNDNSSENF